MSPSTRVKPVNPSRGQLTDDIDVQSLWTRLHPRWRCRRAVSHGGRWRASCWPSKHLE